MKKKTYLLITFCFAVLFIRAQKEELYQNSILIELFTSEGCGSCPIADEFMDDLLYYADSTKMPIYVIDFHVDIWNKSGWVDPFSDSNHTNRLKSYLKRKEWVHMYTPMAILNGREQHAGHARKEIGKFIQKELYEPSKHFLRIRLQPIEGETDSVLVSYTVWGPSDSLTLNVALLQKKINSQVTAGENKDKILHHNNVVRQFKSVPITGKTGSLKMYLNPNLILTNFRFLAYIQHQRTWDVYATDQINFTK
ncbi:MAG: DUF1223 domain-containing protein [Bacteroidia bacterium]